MTSIEGTVRLLTLGPLVELSEAAARSPRGRLNLNLHGPDDPVHRLFNAIEPGSYVRPHRHLHPPKAETVVVVAGALGLVVFGEGGEVVETAVLRPGTETFGVDLPAGSWHTFVSLQEGTVFFETKAGPYLPPSERDMASWAPPEGSPGAPAAELRFRKIFET